MWDERRIVALTEPALVGLPGPLLLPQRDQFGFGVQFKFEILEPDFGRAAGMDLQAKHAAQRRHWYLPNQRTCGR